jgi:YegS/Rv2252/BmrU family lipid kinase
MSRAAVVANPARRSNRARLRTLVCAAMARHGWGEPLWLETSAGDPGERMARTAVQAQVDLVLASGGDGTVTACAAALAGSGIPLAVLPAGTGNLLARNLGLPLALDDALAVALTGADRYLDVGVANGRPFLVMAGIGFDARALDSSQRLKKNLGWGAYYAAALGHLRDKPMGVQLRADSRAPVRLRASALIIGNVGSLPGGVALLPDARPDDGLLDLVAVTAQGLAGWFAVGTGLLLRHGTAQLARMTFRELHVHLDGEQPWQLDGESMGRASQLKVTVQAGQLLLRGPALAAS